MTDMEFSRKHIVLIGMIALFTMGLIVTAITAQKAYSLQLMGFRIDVPVGTSLFVLTFLATDTISELFGRKWAITVVLSGFAVRLLVAGFIWFAVSVEPADWFAARNESYGAVLAGTQRILIAGILTYPVSQLTDVFLFDYFRRKHEGRNLLWLRNNGSTFISQFIDSGLFVTLAFYGVVPNELLFAMIAGQVVVKWTIALADTPVVYIVRNWALNRPILDLKG